MTNATVPPYLDPVWFGGEPPIAIDRHDGPYVTCKPICDALNIPWLSALNEMRTNPLYRGCLVTERISRPDGAVERMVCMKITMLYGWVFKLEAPHASPEAKAKHIVFQRQCVAVLPDATPADPDQPLN